MTDDPMTRFCPKFRPVAPIPLLTNSYLSWIRKHDRVLTCNDITTSPLLPFIKKKEKNKSNESMGNYEVGNENFAFSLYHIIGLPSLCY